MKILTKLTLAFLLVSLLPLTGANLFSYWSTRKVLTQKVLNQLDSVATIQEHRLEEQINQNLEKLSLVSSRTQLRRNLESFINNSKQSASSQQRIQDEMSQMLMDSKSSINSFKEISLLTLDGRVVASTDASSVGTNHSSADFFIKGKKENNISDFFFDGNQNVRVHLSGPIYSDNRLLGVTLVELDPNNLTSLVKDYSGLGRTGETTLAQKTKSGDGITISPLRFNPHAALRVAIPRSSLKRPMTQALLKREQLLPNSVNYRGKPVLAVSRYLPEVDWGLTVIIEQEEAFAPIHELQNSLLLTIVTSSTGIILVSFYVARSATKPVISLTQIASKISSGDLSQRVNITSTDEVGTLAQTFNQMAESLLKARTGLEQQVEARTAQLQEEITERTKIEQELRESKLFAERITEQSTSIIYVLDLDTMTNVYSNRNVAQLIGYSLEQTQSMGRDFLSNVIHPDDLLDRLYRFEMFKYARDDEVIEFEQRVRHASGEWRWIWSREIVFKRRSNGTPCQIIGTAQDITERKQTEVELQQTRDHLERRVAERTAELETAIISLGLEIAEREQAEREIGLLQDIGQAVSESSDFHAALEVALYKVCEVTGWGYGESWIPSSDHTTLHYGPVWYGSEATLEPFRQFSETLTFTPGEGLPGRVWSSKQTEWIQDVSAQPESIFLRAETAISTGLKAALGIPVIANDQVLAVLVFFMFESHEEDERLVRVISAIATQVGSVIQRKQAEAALQESEGRYRTLITTSVQIIWTNNAEGKMVGEQPGWGAFTGQTYEQYQNYGWSEAIHPTDREHTLQQWYKAVEQRGLFEVEHRVRRYDGEYRHFAVRAVPVLEPSGSIREWVGTHTDITEAKRSEAERQSAELALREAHVHLESALVAGAVYTWIWKIPGDRVIVNAAFAHLFAVDPAGAATEGLSIEFFINAMHEEDRPRISAAIQQAIETGEEYATEYRVRTASGEERWLTARGRVECDAAGNPVSFPGALIDITDHKQTEEALRQSEERYRMLFESIDEGFCVIEMLFDQNNVPIDYRFSEINPAFEKQSGLVQALGKRMLQLAPNHEKHWFEIYGKVAMTGEPVRFENRAEALHRWFDGYAFRIGQPESRKVAVLFTDITDRKQAEELLEASERQLRMVTDHTPILIAYWDMEQRYRFVNKGYAERFGLTREEVIGKRMPEVVGEEAYSTFQQQVDTALSGQSVEFEVEVPYQGIGQHYMHIAYVPEFGPQGEVQGLIAAISDITERKQAEMELSENANRFRFLAESTPQIVWTGRPDGFIDYYNQRWYDYTGMTFEQTQGWGWKPVLHPDDLQRCIDTWTHSFTTGEPLLIEYRFKRASDEMYRWHLGQALPRRDETGAIVQWIGVCTDIHDQKELETQLRIFQSKLEARVQARTQELADTNQRLQAILDNIGDGVIVINKQGEFLLYNPAAAKILGVGSTTESPDKWSQEYGLYLPDMVTPYPDHDLPLALAIRGVVADEIEVFSRTQQKPTGVWLSASARPLRDTSGAVTGGIAVFHDVTERKRAEKNLQGYAAKLEKANQELEQFNYVAAHDLKTPLRTINTRIDLLAKQVKPLNQTAQHQLLRISLAAQRMDCLLNDLITYSQIGNRVRPLVSTNSQVIVRQVLQQLKGLIQKSGATIEVEEPLPTVLADATQLAQAWQHLISNSLKFCHITPHIKISATCALAECTFCVEDNGIGIPSESQQRIFGVFKRLNNQEKYEGTGIGLAVVERILNWHGGRIWVESEAGKGSKFFFTLRKADSPEE